ncbi:elongation factor 1-beta [Candidatus Woesearchaeota archaeon CG10_big_fil_rev_8_21_14_0_10_32_9]|nr:MAG: elongation factor 1-beta [Candidatus Woesearchaeota archaeon CG10_big_fil_rev_8_21_14_0_10_32_9]
MASAIVTIKVMPASPETNMDELEIKVKQAIINFAGEGETRTEVVPVAFGLKSLNVTFVMAEAKGSPDPLAEEIDSYEEVNSAEISDVRRAVG